MPPREIARAGFENLPAAIGRAGERAAWRFVEFFSATTRNKNTRAAYVKAVGQLDRGGQRDQSDVVSDLEQYTREPWF